MRRINLLLLLQIITALMLFCTLISGNSLAAVAHISANGSNAPLTLNDSQSLSIAVGLEGDGESGINADWWIVANTPFGWYHYELDGSWKPDLIAWGFYI